MKLRALQKKAAEMGVDEEDLDDAEDKSEAIALIMALMAEPFSPGDRSSDVEVSSASAADRQRWLAYRDATVRLADEEVEKIRDRDLVDEERYEEYDESDSNDSDAIRARLEASMFEHPAWAYVCPLRAGELPRVREIFEMVDTDTYGVLSQEEYRVYLKGIGEWDDSDCHYTDAGDMSWASACRELQCTTEGVTAEAFERGSCTEGFMWACLRRTSASASRLDWLRRNRT